MPPQPLALVNSGVSLLLSQEEISFGHHVCGCGTMEDFEGGWKSDVVLVLVKSPYVLGKERKIEGHWPS